MRHALIGYGLLLVLAVSQVGCSGSESRAEGDDQTLDSGQLYQRALSSLDAGRFDDAAETLRAISSEAPEAARAHTLLGVIHERSDRSSMAKLEFETAAHTDAQLAEAHSNLGVIELGEGRIEEAEAAFRAAIVADPYLATAHHGLAVALMRSDRIDEARAEAEILGELSAQSAAAAPADARWLRLTPSDNIATLLGEYDAEAERQAAAREAARAARQAKAQAQAKPATRTVTRQLSLPQGTVLQVSLLQPLSSATARVGQEVSARVVGNVIAGRQTMIADGAPVRGRVTEVESSGRVKGRARLGIDFQSVETVGGWRDIQVSMVEGTMVAEGTKKNDAAKIGIGAVAGAILGEVIGDNAAAGAAIGGAAGTAVVLATKGKEIELAEGTRLDLALDAPCAITLRTSEPVD